MSSAVVGAALPALSAQAAVTMLYVDNGAAQCSDAGSGSQAQPYCTVQAAADAAQPGQTVLIAQGVYPEQVTVKNSGSQGNPITFKGSSTYGKAGAHVGVDRSRPDAQSRPHGFLLSGVHDVTVQGLYFDTAQEAVLIADSDRITVDGNQLDSVGRPSQAFPTPSAAVRLTGRTTGSTVSRNRIGASGGPGVAVDTGVTGAVVTTNVVRLAGAAGVVVSDAPGTAVTSNTIVQNCQDGVVLAGNSSGSTVENNIITSATSYQCAPQTSNVELTVSQGSAAGTKADYNLVNTGIGASGYSWAGTRYAGPAEFRVGTGQGTHDLADLAAIVTDGSPFEDETPFEHSPAVDSADAAAPGELATDMYGNARIDDPLVANSGTGVGYYDRGAVELQDPMTLGLTAVGKPDVGGPLTVVVDAASPSLWGPTDLTLDFGDSTTPMTGQYALHQVHSYQQLGTYTLTLTGTDGLGTTRRTSTTVDLSEAGPIQLVMSPEQQSIQRLPSVSFRSYVNSPWPVAKTVIDWGDGTTPDTQGGPPNNPEYYSRHDYPAGGSYTITETVTDDHGRSATASTSASVTGPLAGAPVIGSWYGPGMSYVGLFHNGCWALSGTFAPAKPTVQACFGDSGDVPLSGDWDGVRHAQLGIYRPSIATFALRHDDGSATAVPFGAPGDIPVPGNWDHNGHAQLAIYRPGIATFAVRHDDGSVTTAVFGSPGDMPVIGDWDGVGHLQLGIYRPGITTFALRHDDGSVSAAVYGSPGDVPVTGDWLGKGRTTFGTYRPSTDTFYLCGAYAQYPDLINQLTNY